MKVFLSADMEGPCGIVSWPETERNTPFDYSPMQKQMSREVAAACRGAIAAGAEVDANTSASEMCEILKGQFTGGYTMENAATGDKIGWEANGFVNKSAIQYVIK